jgi:hypothetical protein
MADEYDVTLTVEIRVWADTADAAEVIARKILEDVEHVNVQDTAHVTSYTENGYITEKIIRDLSETGPTVYDHDARPDDDNEPGDRCKDCGDDIVWIGPSHVDWLHVADARNQ